MLRPDWLHFLSMAWFGAGHELQAHRVAHESVHGDTGDGPHRLMHPECARWLLAKGPPYPALPPLPLMPPQHQKLPLTAGVAEGATMLLHAAGAVEAKQPNGSAFHVFI